MEKESPENFRNRSEILFGSSAMAMLSRSHVLIAGIGGVGGYAAEAIARAGIGKLTVYDPDTVNPSNINRQILALHSNCGTYKTEVLKKRLLDINPDLQLQAHACALTLENIPQILDSGEFDYIVDAIDPVVEKCCLLANAYIRKIPVISAMGAGFRLDPGKVGFADISKTSNCALARAVRSKLRKEYNISKGILCVFSSETAVVKAVPESSGKRPPVGSSSYMPGIFGLFMASEVIRQLTQSKSQ